MLKLKINGYALIAILLLVGCSSDKGGELSVESGTGTSPQPVITTPDIEILPGEMPTENTLQDTMWKLTSLEREDGTGYSPQSDLSYFLHLKTNDFRIHFWCVYRDGNYKVLNDGVFATTSLNVMNVFDCPAPPRDDEPDIEILLTGFFDGKTIMSVQTETELELRSLANEVLLFSVCETNCLNTF